MSDIGRGYGIFETVRTYENKGLPTIDRHLNRLFRSAKKIDLKLKYSKKQIQEMTKRVVKKSPHKLQRIKITCITDHTIIVSTPLEINEKDYEGVSVLSIEQTRSLPDIKSISYLPSFLSHERAIKKGFYEAILIDKSGEVYEGAYSNIFWFEGNTLCTRKDKVLPGITREIILEKSPFKVKFKNIKIDKLKEKSEVFLTSSVKGIVPITKIDNKKIGDGKPGTNTKKLCLVLPF